ncbi:gustatory and pheromone receptor 39a [Scaptodrosophila lebanonensis]|uniref:Gustatory receptor n=1 Tax=Drosophila lebanonensis TaxID=7225 RepID=A0A6J2TQ67_DROLE|nr:gustatory and pheromone receptor 39a [Scaptodrosophila lebanonensis]
MSVNRDLRLYLRVLYSLGMLCAEFDVGTCTLHVTRSSERYAWFYTLVILSAAIALFIYAHIEPKQFYLPNYNRTGNFYETVNFRSSCMVLWLLYVCFYVRRHRHAALVQTLLRLNRRCIDLKLQRRFLGNFVLYVMLFLLCVGNYLNGFSQSGLSPFAIAVYMITYSYSFLVMCLLLVFFDCLRWILTSGIQHYNHILQRNSPQIWRKALHARQSLIKLGTDELNECFGLLFLPIIALVLLVANDGPFYLISTVFESKFGSGWQSLSIGVTACFWSMPWLIMLVMLHNNTLSEEANKTAKILAKMPRTGTGLDRMVDKFLLKNLRQQPILTAYGFFALDKSTLFKLFTAIFTYMVILVQFKEMENSTKSLQAYQL